MNRRSSSSHNFGRHRDTSRNCLHGCCKLIHEMKVQILDTRCEEFVQTICRFVSTFPFDAQRAIVIGESLRAGQRSVLEQISLPANGEVGLWSAEIPFSRQYRAQSTGCRDV